MSFSEFERKRIEHVLARYGERRVPPGKQAQRRLDYQLKGDLVSVREYTSDSSGTGRWIPSRSFELRFEPKARTWSVYVPDPSGRPQPHALLGGWENLEDLLDQLSGEPTAIVWG